MDGESGDGSLDTDSRWALPLQLLHDGKCMKILDAQRNLELCASRPVKRCHEEMHKC